MKKTGLLLVAATILGAASLTSCGKKFEPNADVVAAIQDAETLTHDQLFKKAAEELGTSGKLKILATTSRGGKDTVKNLFIEELKKHNAAISDPLAYDTTVDGKIYTTLDAEIKSGTRDGYSGTITQDGYQLQTKGIATGYYLNYVPKTWKDAAGADLTAKDPFTLQYNFKTWMVNNKNKNVTIDNVWDVTDSSMKGKIDTMDPRNENVNMDWLIQLTDDEQNAALKAAYEDSSKTSDVDVENYKKYGEKKYAYAFIDKFLTNAVFYEDDGEAMTHLAKTPGNVGWIVYSKLLKVEETASITKADIVIPALGNVTDGANPGASKIKGFAGFMYKHYLQVLPNAKYPYATCAFFELISTNDKAYSVWGADVGDYPSLPSINKDRTKGGHGEVAEVDEKDKDGNLTGKKVIKFTQSDDGENLFSCLNDPTSNWWINTGKAVVENPSFIGPNYKKVIPAITKSIADKNVK